MALFDFLKRKKSKSKPRPPKKADVSLPAKEDFKEDENSAPSAFKEKDSSSRSASRMLLRPHVTEKASLGQESGSYVFEVEKEANKAQVRTAVQELYGVKVEKVNIVNMPGKKRFSRARVGRRPGYKKALVILKKGQSIESHRP